MTRTISTTRRQTADSRIVIEVTCYYADGTAEALTADFCHADSLRWLDGQDEDAFVEKQAKRLDRRRAKRLFWARLKKLVFDRFTKHPRNPKL